MMPLDLDLSGDTITPMYQVHIFNCVPLQPHNEFSVLLKTIDIVIAHPQPTDHQSSTSKSADPQL